MSLRCLKIFQWFYVVLNRFYPELNPQNCFRIGNTLLLKPKLSMFVGPEPSTYLIA